VQKALQDPFGRRFSYLRLSVTDACNFRCVYCLPSGYKKLKDSDEPLTLNEISNLVSAFSEMGTIKVRLTGGEPTLRRDFLEIASLVGQIPGIKEVGVSTNGFHLKQLAKPLKAAGVTAVNVSVDSLDRNKFAEITGTDQLPQIIDGIEEALCSGFSKVKINAVLLKSLNEDSIEEFLKLVKLKPIAIRFIELMPTGQTKEFFAKHHIQATYLMQKLVGLGWIPKQRGLSDGPALEFSHSEYIGQMGIIAPYSKDFCSTCNRLRVTSQGALRLCLFGEGNHELRDLLQKSSQKEELKNRVIEILNKKEISHYLPEGRYGNNNTFSAMGG
jgi:cyclic pyranopterin phosphate synthase